MQMLTQRQGWWRVLLAAMLAAAMLPVQARAQEDVDAAAKQLIAAYGFIKQGQFKFAADELTSFLNKYPKHAEATNARYALCISLYRIQRYDEAAKEIPNVLADAAFKQRDEALAILGHCHLTLKENAKALAAFDELLQKHGESKYAEGASLNKAQVLFMMEKKDEAAKACQAFIDKFPKSAHRANGLYTLALAQHALTRLADAEATLAALLKEFPASPYALDAQLLLGQCQESQNKLKEAGESFTLALALAPPPRQAEVRYRLAVVQHNAAKYDEAIKQLEAILADHKDSPHAAPARLQLGKSQYDANKVADARKTLTAVAEADKDRGGEARYWIAQCDIADRKYADAARILDALSLSSPAPANLDEIDFYRAVCQMQLEQYAAATTAFATFATKYAKSPRLTEATYHRAFCLHRQQKYDDSRKACETVVAEPVPPAVIGPT